MDQQQNPQPQFQRPPPYPRNPPLPDNEYGDEGLRHEDEASRKDNAVREAEVQNKKEQFPKIAIVKNVNKELFDNTTEEENVRYPFYQLEVGQGFFVPVDDKLNQQQLVSNMHSSLAAIRQSHAEIEYDADGDEVWETVVIKSRQRNADGTLKLQADGTPFGESASQVMRPMLINPRRFIVKPVVKDYEVGEGSKAERDGVVVIRVA